MIFSSVARLAVHWTETRFIFLEMFAPFVHSIFFRKKETFLSNSFRIFNQLVSLFASLPYSAGWLYYGCRGSVLFSEAKPREDRARVNLMACAAFPISGKNKFGNFNGIDNCTGRKLEQGTREILTAPYSRKKLHAGVLAKCWCIVKKIAVSNLLNFIFPLKKLNPMIEVCR